MVTANERNRLTPSLADFAKPLIRFASADYSFA
jgi:hypothetical protein